MSNNIDSSYPFLVSEVMKYIEEVKQKDRSAAIVDIIIDFARHKDIDIDIIGDAISDNVYLKSFIEKDCQMHDFIHTDKTALGEW